MRALAFACVGLLAAGCGSSLPQSSPAAAAASSTTTPSTAPSPAQFGFQMTTSDGAHIAVVVQDVDDLLASARPATAQDIRLIEASLTGLVTAQPGPQADELTVAWIGGACDKSVSIQVTPASIRVATGPHPACDASAAGRGVVLAFRGAVPQPSVTFEPGRPY